MNCAHSCLVSLLALFVWGNAIAAVSPPGTFRDCATCPEMIVIPAGSFEMGVAPGEEARENLAAEFRGRSEPQHRVSIKRFAIGRFEVTRGQYRAFVEATGHKSDGCFVWKYGRFELEPERHWRSPGYTQDDDHPATCVSWQDASAYAAWLARSTGRKYRLLAEAEWEYAARGGTKTARFWGEDQETSCEYANAADWRTAVHVPEAHSWSIVACNDRYAYTAPVGSYPPNAFGLHDMLGNVAEWTQDCWNPNYTGARADGGAATRGDCALRAVRGGSWEDGPVGIRAAYRVGSPTSVRVYTRGLRVAADP